MDRLANIVAFVRVVENGGFTAAARHLNVSPTMVSNHVQELEDRLGARLLNRTTRKVSLTEIGLGVTLVAPFNLHDELRAGSIVPLLRNYPTPEFSIAAVYPHRRHLAAKVRVFIDALAGAFAGRDWVDPKRAARPG